VKILLKYLLLFGFFISAETLYAQSEKQKTFSAGGYFSGLQTLLPLPHADMLLSEHHLLSRLNLSFRPCKKISAYAAGRFRFVTGDFHSIVPAYAGMAEADAGIADLSWNILENNNSFFNVNIDRLNARLSLGKAEISLGRQRINWGQSLVWNPNDIFNAYSYFDIDYEERRGADALRLQYYTSSTSVLETAFSLDNRSRLTAAGLYRFNHGGYDIQFLAGIAGGKTYVAGCGWSGNIGNASFYGEYTYFLSDSAVKPHAGISKASSGLFYIFQNSLSLQTELLYNGGHNSNDSSLVMFYGSEESGELQFISEYAVMGNVAYPISSLWNLSLAGMYFPDRKGFYTGPSLSYSVSDNAGISLLSQHFGMKAPGGKMSFMHLIFLRMKISF
jgi:hypothetical protein